MTCHGASVATALGTVSHVGCEWAVHCARGGAGLGLSEGCMGGVMFSVLVALGWCNAVSGGVVVVSGGVGASVASGLGPGVG